MLRKGTRWTGAKLEWRSDWEGEDQRLGGIHPEHEPIQGFQAGAERNLRDPAF